MKRLSSNSAAARSARVARCVWLSMSPGMTYSPRASSTSASGQASGDSSSVGASAAILPLRTTIDMSGMSAAPVPSNTETPS
ncbi:MAG: hypothetical protein OXJ54_09885 [Gemmatimonadetes bacterium]|nr:hypothetical protein [Candidatus Palauibacter rhopaloidicola]